MNYVILDLEWNQASVKRNENPDITFEIIEIGAVKMDETGLILDEFDQLIIPVVYPELYSRVRDVVHLLAKQLERQGVPFSEAMERFWDWCGEDVMFCTWGSMDLTELQKNIRYHQLENRFPFPLFYYDIQKLYSLQYLDGKARCSLEAAVDELGLGIGEAFHRAVSDAYYTALVMATLSMKKLKPLVSVDYFRVPANRKEEIYLVFNRYSKFVSMAYPTREQAMQAHNVTSTVCYKCGRNVERRLNWFADNTKHYYSLSYCPLHGWLKGKIRTKKALGSEQIFMIKTLKLVSPDDAAAIYCRHEELRMKRREKRQK